MPFIGSVCTAPMIKRKHQLLDSIFLFKTGSKGKDILLSRLQRE